MNEKAKTKGPWINRFAVYFFSIVLGILIFWLLGFLVSDIKTIEGPDYETIENKYIDASLKEKRGTYEKQIEELTQKINQQKEKQNLIGDSTSSLQLTINQLLELQKLSIQKNVSMSEKEKGNLDNSLNLFLENQKKYQEVNQTITHLSDQKVSIEGEKAINDKKIKKQKKSVDEEFKKINRKHDLKLAFYQLAVLTPLLVLAALIIAKKISSIYSPLFLAFGVATLIKVSLVMHEYFPSRYFKYVLTIILILAVAKFLIYCIKSIAFPKAQLLMKQYREAYERFLCPVCEYPIRTGPRRFLYWTRRTVNKIVLPESGEFNNTLYTCPSCGTELFEDCDSCHKVRQSLLPFCEHCGNEKNI